VTDGKNIIPLVPTQDHKRVGDNDAGPNTGGMGAYAPVPLVDEGVATRIINKVFWPLLDGLRKEGRPYRGLLYAGVMLRDKEPYVLEFNVRFGDPETQVILPKLKTDLLEIMLKAADENGLSGIRLGWDERFCVCVVMASAGYPGSYAAGKPIAGLDKIADVEDLLVFHAGTKYEAKAAAPETKEEAYVRSVKGIPVSKIVTSGGRVLDVVGFGSTIQEAQLKVYSNINTISFDGSFYRHDIGSKAAKMEAQ